MNTGLHKSTFLGEENPGSGSSTKEKTRGVSRPSCSLQIIKFMSQIVISLCGLIIQVAFLSPFISHSKNTFYPYKEGRVLIDTFDFRKKTYFLQSYRVVAGVSECNSWDTEQRGGQRMFNVY